MEQRAQGKYQLDRSFRHFKSRNDDDLCESQTGRALAILRDAYSANAIPSGSQRMMDKIHESLSEQRNGGSPEFQICPYAADEMIRIDDDDIIRYLFHRYRYVVNPKQKILDSYPPCIQIEVSSKCNFRCKFCYQSDASFSNPRTAYMGTMSFDSFKGIIDQIEEHVEFVTLASRGEPLLAKDFVRMVEYTKGKFLSLKINTNASVLGDEQIHCILASGVSTLVFSADAADEEQYKEYRINGDFKRTLRNIARFGEIRESEYPDSKIVTRVSGVLVDPETQSIDEMRAFWGELVDQVAFVNYSPWEKIYQAPQNSITEPCSDLWRRMFVWFDGSVSPCDNDYKAMLRVGTIEGETLGELWNNSNYQEIRDVHIGSMRGNQEPCKRCIVM